MVEQARLCPHCGGNIETELNCSICRVLFGIGKTFRSEDWVRRAPGPATKAMLNLAAEWAKERLYGERLLMTAESLGQLQAFLAEWPDAATVPTPEQPAPSSPWKCCLCGEPVRLTSDLQPWHLNGPTNHDAELSDVDKKTLADGLRLTD